MAEEAEVEASGRTRSEAARRSSPKAVSDALKRTGERAERRGDVTVREGGLSTVCSGAQAESPRSSLGLGDACSELAH